jgi:hypothetical protein
MCEVSLGGADEDELHIFVESFILELSYNFISSPFPLLLSFFVSFLLIKDISSSSTEFLIQNSKFLLNFNFSSNLILFF